jgi:hypothetical protein
MADGKDMGKFKSSGIIISTGTGSTGWLYSAKQVTCYDIETIQKFLGVHEYTELVSISYIIISVFRQIDNYLS